MKKKKVSTRRCIGCRDRDERTNLVRFYCPEMRVTVDPRGNSGGRGAYLHRRVACALKAASPKQWEYVLKVKGLLQEDIAELLLDFRRGVLQEGVTSEESNDCKTKKKIRI